MQNLKDEFIYREETQMKADLIVRNARIFTVDSARPWAEAVACAAGRIVAVGSDDELTDLAGPNTQFINAGGQLVLPGLTDAHVHFLWNVIRLRHSQVDLYGVSDFDEVRRRVRQAVEIAGPGQWVHGWGWDESLWDMQPARALLDDISPHTPVALRRVDLHTWWVNSAALKLAGITPETPDLPGSRLGRDITGELTGVLHEWAAIRLVEQYIPEPDAATLQDWLRDAIAEAHRLGLTGIHDQRVQREGSQTLRLFHALRRRGELNLRIHMNIAAEYLTEAATLGVQAGFGDDRLWIGQVKAFADGSMGARTALMLEPFEGEPNNRGIPVTSAENLWELAVQADQAGFPLSVHAIGDRAVQDVVDVLSEFPPDDSSLTFSLPHRIEHVQVIHPDDLPRLSQHGIVASVQPVHLLSDWRTADRVWGRRARYAYAFRSLLDYKTQMAFGSDAPFAPLNPMLGIYAAVTRQDQRGEPKTGWYVEERLSVAETIHGYTMGPAYAAGKQHVQGSITPGKWADMIILDRDIFAIEPMEIAQTQVVMTVFDGRVVYAR